MPHAELIITTAITGAVGWFVKTILDAVKGYTAESCAGDGTAEAVTLSDGSN